MTFLRHPLASLYFTGALTPPISHLPTICDDEVLNLPKRLDAILKVYGDKDGPDAAGTAKAKARELRLSVSAAAFLFVALFTFLEKNKIPITIIVPTGIVQAPFKSLWAVREFLERKSLPASTCTKAEPLCEDSYWHSLF